MLQVGVVAVFLLAAALYTAPSVIAAVKGRKRWLTIVVLNILLGWTLVGWLVALVMSLDLKPRRPAWMKRTPRPRKAVKPSTAAARQEMLDPPEVHEDVYAAWLEEGAGLNAGGKG